ncbi:MAG TPA: hypothetical protein VGO58_00030 [Chitinophagaceae bacterium]|jgi:hypothetical protein|nr:hypothetical protein [Chitinophagaceae bacterium]
MKKKSILALLILLLFFSVNKLHSQTKQQTAEAVAKESTEQAKTLVRTENDLKTGNWQDVLASFFQLGLSDIAGKNRSLEFKANLFALKAKADSTLLVDTNYLKQNFARNFQFEFALKLDSQYRFNGLKAGFKIAIVNRRDTTVLNLLNTAADSLFKVSMTRLQFVLAGFEESLRKNDDENNFKTEKDSLLYLKTEALVKAQVEADRFNSKVLPKEFLQFANIDSIERNFTRFDSLYTAALSKTRKSPLLTFALNGTFLDQPGFFSEGKAELVYLLGVTKKGRNLELDLRANIALVDTVINTIKDRIEFNATGGCNWAIITASNNVNKSLVEFKPHFEYTSILRGVYPGEKKEKFLANAELRIRVMDNLWIPLTLKYDLKDNNFLGFLKVALNMNAFKKPAK